MGMDSRPVNVDDSVVTEAHTLSPVFSVSEGSFQDGSVTCPRISFYLTAQRKPRYYMSNIYMPLFALCCTSLASTIPPVDALSDRMSISLTIVFTVVAVKITVGTYTPPVGYNTYLDLYVLVCLGFTLSVALENVLLLTYVCHGHCHPPLEDDILSLANDIETPLVTTLF